MIRKVVHKGNLNEHSEIRENLAYWLSRTPEERVEAVDLLRKELQGNEQRLQRVIRVRSLKEHTDSEALNEER